MGFVQVDGSSLNSLKRLGLFARNVTNGCLIGLTGSVDKITTRTMIALALESIGTAYQSHGNWNNEVGVALTHWDAEECGVCGVGVGVGDEQERRNIVACSDV